MNQRFVKYNQLGPLILLTITSLNSPTVRKASPGTSVPYHIRTSGASRWLAPYPEYYLGQPASLFDAVRAAKKRHILEPPHVQIILIVRCFHSRSRQALSHGTARD